jgi:4-amino-4-deoxy-L-arabinose transferase-like glycosyltransferase
LNEIPQLDAMPAHGRAGTLPVPAPRRSTFSALVGALKVAAHTEIGNGLGELFILLVFSGFFLLYGLTPWTGGDQLGLVGADEPRYAQIAREMLAAHSEDCHAVHARITPHSLSLHDLRASYDCLVGGTVTPILYGHPWLEKPALYYWRAIGFYKELGVSDWSARIPSASAAFALVFLAFLHLKRFRPGGHLDAALIMVSSVAIVAFARGASTDMQLAAPFCIGMLGWYAWYETGKKFWLFDLYFFGAAATLAKGPVAPLLALAIITVFLGLRRELSALKRTIWLPGVVLYLAMVLPWYIAVQRRNPSFFREFFWQHNIERYTTNLYQHHQPWFYYAIVLVLGLMPWTALAIRALGDGMQISIAEWKVRFKPQRYIGHVRAGDAFPEFLVLWTLLPIVFFTFSGSKLPGYILPSIPPLAILTGDYLFRIRRAGIPEWLLNSHAILTGFLTFVLLLCPQYMVYQRIVPAPHIFVMAALLGIAAAVAVILVVRRWGVERIRLITLVPLCGLMVFLLGFNGHLLDLNYSARPLAEQIAKAAPDTRSVAELDVRRDLVYGVAFYRDHEVRNYATEGVPAGEHILIIPTRETPLLQQYLAGRVYQQIFLYPTQGLSVFRVYPMNPDELNAHPPSNTADTPPVTPARNPGLTTGS